MAVLALLGPGRNPEPLTNNPQAHLDTTLNKFGLDGQLAA
jgi:hypothetical protein